MLTYGYLREATQAHLDLDEQELQAMNLQTRYHIFANEAMLAICAVKPKYDYFKVNIVEEYAPIINLGNNLFRAATLEELEWERYYSARPNFADTTYTTKWYEGQNIYLIGNPVRMPSDFLAFAAKQAWAFVVYDNNSENFVNGLTITSLVPTRVAADKTMFMYSGSNTVTFLQEGEFWIPYKGLWCQFNSNMKDDDFVNGPIDILLTIPLYIAAQCLQVDHIQKANAKRSEFELALARINNTDFLAGKLITPSYR